MSEEIKRVKRELMYEGTILKIYKDHMQFENGNTAEWDFIHHDGAAAVVPIMEDGRILMVTQYRNALERDTLEIPAGKLDDPNDPVWCVHHGSWRRRRATAVKIWSGSLHFAQPLLFVMSGLKSMLPRI